MDLTKIGRAIDACLAARRQDMIRLLADWIRIPSVRGEAQPDAPEGDFRPADCFSFVIFRPKVQIRAPHWADGQSAKDAANAVVVRRKYPPEGDFHPADCFHS